MTPVRNGLLRCDRQAFENVIHGFTDFIPSWINFENHVEKGSEIEGASPRAADLEYPYAPPGSPPTHLTASRELTESRSVDWKTSETSLPSSNPLIFFGRVLAEQLPYNGETNWYKSITKAIP